MPDKEDEPATYSGEKARQGDIVLRSRRRRIIFIAGLVGLVVIAVLARCVAMH